MELLEREEQFQALDRWFEDARAGNGSVVVLAGEAGAGKSSVALTFAGLTRNRARVLVGACDALSTPRPLGPFLDVEAQFTPPTRQLLRAPERNPELFASILGELSGNRPTLFVIEDIHWADQATLDLLRYLGRRIVATPTLLVVTVRDDELAAHQGAQAVIGDLAAMASTHRLRVNALSADAVAMLAEGTGIDRQELFRRTGGNPFFVTEVLGAETGTIPPTVRDAVLARAARLTPASRAVLDAAAIIGLRAESWLLTAIVPEATAATDGCLELGLLRAEGDCVLFRHQIARETVLDAIAPPRGVDLHARVLVALRQRVSTVADSPRLAHHAEAANDTASTIHFATEAGARAAGLGAHREAAAQYARAIRHAGDLDAIARAAILAAWLPELFVIGEVRQGVEVTTQLIEAAHDRGDAPDEAKWLAWKARCLTFDGRNAEAERAIEAAIDLLAAIPPAPTHAEIWQAQSSLRMLDRDYEQSIAWGERALAVARTFNLPRFEAGALNAMGSSRLIGLDEERGRADLERGLQVARDAGLDSQVAAILGNLGSGHGEIFDLARAGHYLTEGIAFTREHDLDGYFWYQTAWLSLVRLHQGAWPEAGSLAASVMDSPGSDAISRMMALVAQGRLRTRRGDPDAMVALDAALDLAAPTGTLQRLAPVRAARAEAAWAAGNASQAATEARAAYDLAVEARHRWHIGELGYWRWLAGDLPVPEPGAWAPYALQMRGEAEAAGEAWLELGCPYEAARALAESDGEAHLRRAFTIFDQLGARPASFAVARKLRDLGVPAIPRGVRSSTRGNPALLTARERDVLALVGEHLTNSEIAARLYLSPKTVERHLTSIMSKLSVSSRQEAAAAIAAIESQSGGTSAPV